jgi:hypothetical protein
VLGGQPEDELDPLRAELAVLAARYTERHPDVVKATHALEQRTVVIEAWQCLEAAHERQVPKTTKACVSYGEGLSAVDMALMDRVLEGRDLADLKEREQAWSEFRALSSYYEGVTRKRHSADSGNAFPRVPRRDWLLLIDVLDRAGDSDGARRERAKFERQSPADWFDCSGPLRGEDFVVFMSARLAAVEEIMQGRFYSGSGPSKYPTPRDLIEGLRQEFERCATESLGWSAADVAVWVRQLQGRTDDGF